MEKIVFSSSSVKNRVSLLSNGAWCITSFYFVYDDIVYSSHDDMPSRGTLCVSVQKFNLIAIKRQFVCVCVRGSIFIHSLHFIKKAQLFYKYKLFIQFW